MGIIYVLENKINGKCYVGQTTKTFEHRLQSHQKSKYAIGNAIRKYGIDNFNKYIYYVPDDLLDYFEVEMIIKLNSISPYGYNLESGGNKNKKLSEETKNRLREYCGEKGNWYGKKHSEETRRKISEHNIGHRHSEETKQKISESHKGKKQSAKWLEMIKQINSNPSKETRKKMSESHRGKKFTEEHKKKLSESAKRRYSK